MSKTAISIQKSDSATNAAKNNAPRPRSSSSFLPSPRPPLVAESQSISNITNPLISNVAVRPQSDLHRSGPARGATLGGRATFVGRPSPRLAAHELVHMAQQRLGVQTHTEPALRSSLEAEAEHLAPRLLAGEPVQIKHAAPPGVPLFGTDPDKTYTSTEGLVTNDGYIANAYEFHQKWGYNPIKVASIEEVVSDLAGGTSKLNRIRIVSHASQSGLFMRFTQGGRLGVLEQELAARTQESTEQAGVLTDARWVINSATEDFRKWLVQNHAALAGRLGITNTGIADGEVERYFRWILNKHRAEGVPGISQTERDRIMPAVDFEVLGARTILDIGGNYSSSDLYELKTTLLGRKFGWSALTVGDSLQEAIDRASEVHTAYGSRDLGKKQTKMRKRFGSTSTVEIRGCALGQSKSYMESVQSYFGTGKEKPAVHAPKLYQYYGNIGLYVTNNTDAQIRLHWTKWKHRSNLRANFKRWASVYAPAQKIPAVPSWTDLATFLRAGHALPIRGGARLFVLKGMSEGQVLDWFTKNDQRLTTANAIKNQFTRPMHEEAVQSNIFEWLQDAYTDTPNQRIFPYDPRWSSQFESLAGVAPPAKPKAEEK